MGRPCRGVVRGLGSLREMVPVEDIRVHLVRSGRCLGRFLNVDKNTVTAAPRLVDGVRMVCPTRETGNSRGLSSES